MGRLEVNSAVGLNVRSGPGLTYPVLDTLNNGDVIDEVLIDGWVMLVMDDESFGFVSRKLLIPAPPINTPEPSVPSTSDVRLQAASFLVSKGWSDVQAAAIVGNLMQESNLKPTAVNPSSGATGIAQWLGDRLTALQAKANWQDLQVQLDFVDEELNGSEKTAGDAIRLTTALDAATMAVRVSYERCGENEAADANRLAQATTAYNLLLQTAPPLVAVAGVPVWITLARKYLGTKEAAGTADNPLIVSWDKLMTTLPASMDHDATPWCAIFVHAMLLLSGYKGKIIESALAVDWRKFGVHVDDPRAGDVVVFDFGGGDHHVAFVISVTGGMVHVIGGNQSDAVTLASYSTDYVMEYRRAA